MGQTIATYGTLLASIVTAVATFFLWRVTGLLASETTRMADAGRPQIVANITPNQWSVIHLDISVENTGNATAFDIEVAFDPPLVNGEARGEEVAVPFQKISILKPGQALNSYLSEVGDYLEKQFAVTISWKTHPLHQKRETLSYTLNMADFRGVSYLGSRDPLVQVAQEVKHLREDWRNVASGSRKIKTDNYDSADRQREREALEARYRREQDKG
ncbi:MAG: hypothetical protein CL949_01840 [Erythrobacter sp.]|nr:hypothetical protein [Erythrobacter sp.]|tara:strand:+ start:2526 stop:3173 length:648 start_codon:yes stop_codon:yes gene_type:complete